MYLAPSYRQYIKDRMGDPNGAATDWTGATGNPNINH